MSISFMWASLAALEVEVERGRSLTFTNLPLIGSL